MIKDNNIPEIGLEYHFFDDGKISPSRHSIAKVIRKLTTKEAKKLMFERKDFDYEYYYDESLYNIWKDEIDKHTDANNKPWLYAEETDYFIECFIPEYDNNTIWFVRTVDGGWFSLNIQSSWQTGRLDVTGEIFEQWEELFPEEYYRYKNLNNKDNGSN